MEQVKNSADPVYVTAGGANRLSQVALKRVSNGPLSAVIQNTIHVFDTEGGACQLLAEIFTGDIKLFMLSSFMLRVISCMADNNSNLLQLPF
jgi:hypothetical protein